MQHKNYFTFKASSNFDLGLQMGETFKKELSDLLVSAKSQPNWETRTSSAQQYLSYAESEFPNLVDELKGYAKAAKISFEEMWTLNLEEELDHFKEEKCTTVVTNNGLLVSHNEDWEVGTEHLVYLVKKTINDLTIFELLYFNTLGGNSISINSHGTVQSINTLTHKDWQLGIPRNIIARWMSETNNPPKDFERLKALRRSAGYNHVFINKDGKIWNLESSAKKQELTSPSFPFVHTNHYLGSLKDQEARDSANSSFNRYKKASALIKSTMTMDELIALNSDVSEGGAISVFNKRTIGKMVFDLQNKITVVWLKREASLGWVEYPLTFF